MHKWAAHVKEADPKTCETTTDSIPYSTVKSKITESETKQF